MKGFTLIETIIYIAIFSILISGLLNASYVLLSNLDRHDAQIAALAEGNFIRDKIDWLLAGASTVYAPSLNATSTTLRLKNGDSIYRIEFDAGGLSYKKDFDTASILTGSQTIVKDFAVEHGQKAPAPAWVRVSFSIGGIPFSIIRYTRL